MAADRWAVLAPESVPAHESAATAMLNVGDYFGAEFQLLSILEILEDSTDAWMLISRILSQAGDPSQADLVVEHLAEVRTDADPANVYFARSQLAVQGRNLNEAFEYARRAAELKPDRPDFLTWAGRVALNMELKETGMEYIRRAWELDPENHDLALGYADLLARNGEAEQARKVMREMTQTPDVMLSRILFELSAKNRDGALALLNEFETMEFADSDEKAFYQAQAAEALVLRRQAIEYYGRVQEGERMLAASLRRAELIWLEGDEDTARAALEKIRTQPSELAVEQSWLTEARILREAGRKEQAYGVLDRAITQLPASIPLLYSHSLLAAELGWVDIAEKDLRTILAAQPDNAAALNALGYTLADQTDRYEEAETLIRQAYILQPNEASIVDSMGWIAYRLGRNQEALEFLARAWELDRNPEIAAHLGEVLWVTGQKDEALGIWREGAEIDAANSVLVETLERLGVEL
jgi:tetratricopeptide (TPR) repeat protein